jgi:CheY-like chemotaxis protein
MAERSDVLVVDDQPEIRAMLAEYLTMRGVRVHTAVDGIEALHLAERVHPSLVLLDLLMPRMDGWQTIRAMRSDPATKDAVIVVVSGCSVPNSEDLARQAGCQEVLRKPIDLSYLDAVFDRWFRADGRPRKKPDLTT